MSGIEEAYAKYAKGLVEHKLNLALDRLDEQGAIIGNLKGQISLLERKLAGLNLDTCSLSKINDMILNLQEKVERLNERLDTDDKRFDVAFERIDAIQNKVEGLDNQINGDDEEEEENLQKRCIQALDAEFIKQQLYENYQLLEKIDKHIRLKDL